MAKKKRKAVKVEVGLAHVEAALDILLQDVEDIRLVVGELRRKERPRGRLKVKPSPGLACVYAGPGESCNKAGKPCEQVRPGKDCIATPGDPCQPVKPSKTTCPPGPGDACRVVARRASVERRIAGRVAGGRGPGDPCDLD